MSLVTLKRQQAGLSLSELARRADMLVTKLWKIEHGVRKLTDRDIAQLAYALQCSPSDLIPPFPGEEPPPGTPPT